MTVHKVIKENGIAKPAPFNYIQAMKLVLDMEAKLAGNETLISFAIKLAIKQNSPADHIITQVKDMIRDSYTTMCEMFGMELTNRIKTFS